MYAAGWQGFAFSNTGVIVQKIMMNKLIKQFVSHFQKRTWNAIQSLIVYFSKLLIQLTQKSDNNETSIFALKLCTQIEAYYKIVVCTILKIKH